MNRGVSATATVLIFIFIVIISGIILYYMGAPSFSTLKNELSKLSEDDSYVPQAACKSAPKIEYNVDYDYPVFTIDASETHSSCWERVNYFWELDGETYDSDSDLCGNTECSVIACEYPDCETGDEIKLICRGNVSKLESTATIVLEI